MSTLSQFGSGVKLIQRGTITLGFASVTATATITAVNMDKATVNHLGDRGIATDAATFFTTLELTNATTVTARRADSTATGFVTFEVKEYY